MNLQGGSVLDLPVVVAEHAGKVWHTQQKIEAEGYRDDSPARIRLGDAAALHLHAAVDLCEDEVVERTLEPDRRRRQLAVHADNQALLVRALPRKCRRIAQ
jgi:hypothetical protein